MSASSGWLQSRRVRVICVVALSGFWLWATASPAAAGAPTAPAKPTVTADDASVDVTWKTVSSTPIVTAYTVATLNEDGTALISTISVDAASGDDASVTVKKENKPINKI